MDCRGVWPAAWAIDGLLPTFLGVSTRSAATVWMSLLGFVVFYTALAAVDVYLMVRMIRQGPDGLGYWPEQPTIGRPRPSPIEGLHMLNYETLRVIWWLILGVLLVGFAVTDGFDMGVCAIFRFVGRNEEERRALLESVEPVWEGNQVWFILGGGAAFAAWPLLYAASFSSLYVAMFLVLVGFILRPVGFAFPRQAHCAGVAQRLRLGAVRGRGSAGTAVRRGIRQSAARHAVSL